MDLVWGNAEMINHLPFNEVRIDDDLGRLVNRAQQMLVHQLYPVDRMCLGIAHEGKVVHGSLRTVLQSSLSSG